MTPTLRCLQFAVATAALFVLAGFAPVAGAAPQGRPNGRAPARNPAVGASFIPIGAWGPLAPAAAGTSLELDPRSSSSVHLALPSRRHSAAISIC